MLRLLLLRLLQLQAELLLLSHEPLQLLRGLLDVVVVRHCVGSQAELRH